MLLVCYAIINIGRDTIKNKTDLNLIINNIRMQLKDNIEYLPFSNKLANILTSYEKSKQNYDLLIENKKADLIKNTIYIHKNYSSSIEDINRSLKVSINKNEQEIENFKEKTEREVILLEDEILTSKKIYKESIDLAKSKYSRAIFDAEAITKDENESIDLELKELREYYRVESQKIKNRQNIKLNQLDEQFKVVKEDIENKISERRSHTDREIEVLTNDIKELKENTDETYLTIKTTHTQANIRFNEFVNKRKEIKEDNIYDIKISYEKALVPLDEQLEKIKKAYDDELDEIQFNYTEKLKALNVIFDVQKSSYNDKTQDIIGKNNREITKINSDFSDKRDQLENKKKLANDVHREKLLKTTNQDERRRLYRKYQKDVRSLNNQLSNAIELNEKLISEQEIKLQMHLYNHDAKHIEQINKWRQNRNIYDFEKNELFAKAKHKYEHERQNIELNRKLLKDNVVNDKAIQNVMILKDLQPIEIQLAIASLIQEREINLLNTENETYQNSFKLKQSLITNQFFKDELTLRQQLELEKEIYRYQTAIVNIKHQLEFEQTRKKREHLIYILKLNRKLQDSLLRQKRNIEQIKMDSQIYISNLNINNLDARLNYETKVLRQKSLLEFEKRQTIINEIRLKNQRLKISKKNQRTLLLAKADAELHQDINTLMFNRIYEAYEIEPKIKTFLKEFFKLPAHPEVFRQLFNSVIQISQAIKNELKGLLAFFIDVDTKLFINIIDNITEYKYRIKHEEIINLYTNNIEQVTLKRNELLKENTFITSQLAMLKNNRILNDTLIEGLRLERNKAKKAKDKHAEEHSKSKIRILRNENRILRSNLRENDREVIRLSSKVIPLDNEIKAIKKRQEQAEKDLIRKKDKEETKYRNLLNLHIKTYHNFIDYIEKRFLNVNDIYSNIINKAYISTEHFEAKLSKINKEQFKYQSKLNEFQQTLLSNWLDLYLITKTDQDKILINFDKITNFSINKLRKRNTNFINSEKIERDYLKNIFNNEIRRNNEYIKKANESTAIKVKNLQNLYREQYANTEIEIVNHDTTTKKDINIISENLNGVLEQLKKEHLKNVVKIKSEIKKEDRKISRKIKSISTSIDEVNHRNKVRTTAIIDRYERRKDRRYKQMQSTIRKYREEINVLLKNKNDNKSKLNDSIKQNAIKLDKFINNSQSKIKRYRVSSRKEQNKITRKEKRTLKSSYKFKRRQIKAKRK